jgi:Cu-Zn family superoxide dismutase
MKPAVLFCCSALVALTGAAAQHQHSPKPAPAVAKAVAVLYPTQDSKAHGIVMFTKVENGIRIQATVRGLTPGKHGFHVHEYGDCSATNAMSAGGHFVGQGPKHGGPEAGERHAGDFGNIEAGPDGVGRYDRVDTMIAFEGLNNILGRGLIVHEKEDDLTTQPTGAAGGRVACGVVGLAKE